MDDIIWATKFLDNLGCRQPDNPWKQGEIIGMRHKSIPDCCIAFYIITGREIEELHEERNLVYVAELDEYIDHETDEKVKFLANDLDKKYGYMRCPGCQAAGIVAILSKCACEVCRIGRTTYDGK